MNSRTRLARRLAPALLTSALLAFVACKRQPENFSAPNSNAGAAAPRSDGAAIENEKAVLGELTQAVRRFAAEQQKRPADLQELVSKGYLPSIPTAPAGKKFMINKTLAVVLEPQ